MSFALLLAAGAWGLRPGSSFARFNQSADLPKLSQNDLEKLYNAFLEANDMVRRNVSYQPYLIRGVNLGGWFVLEPWITPSIFAPYPSDEVVDEYTFCKYVGKVEAKAILERHWQTWITEQEIKILAEAGINTLRIPVGYWIFGDILDGEPWVTGSDYYLKKAIKWAETYGLKVLIDLHTGPGSQNGFDNSGRKGEIHWDDQAQYPNGTVYYPNIDRTISVLKRIAFEFSSTTDYPNILGIEYLNEPFVTLDINLVKDFYLRTYPIIQRFGRDEGAHFISDAFRLGSWENFMPPPQYQIVYLDTHHYEVFDSGLLRWSQQQHIDNVCNGVKPQLKTLTLWTVVGEWSLAITDCAKWLNGYGVGARWDGTYPGSSYIDSCENFNDPTKFSPAYRAFLREWAEKQFDAYEANQGWFFWTAKTEEAAEWDYIRGYKEGWIVKPSQRMYNC